MFFIDHKLLSYLIQILHIPYLYILIAQIIHLILVLIIKHLHSINYYVLKIFDYQMKV